MRTMVAMPMSRGTVWPAKVSELTTWMLFHLIVSSVAVTTVLATARLQADRSFCKLSTCVILLERSASHEGWRYAPDEGTIPKPRLSILLQQSRSHEYGH